MTKDMIQAKALKTQDAAELYRLVEEALELADFYAAKKAFAEARVAKLTEQVARQSAMIENLEKTM